jgi:uncharacterized protein YjbI with pentapeptide repeats
LLVAMNLPVKNFLRDNSVLLSCTGFALLVVGIPVWTIQQRNVNILEGKIQKINLELESARLDELERLKLKKDILVIDKDKTIILNGIGATIAQALGAVFLGATAYVGYQNFKVGEENLRVLEEKQVTERFSKAIEHLGSDTIDIRLGGIYALEQIAYNSSTYHWTIVEILSAFAREKCSISVKKALPELEVQAEQNNQSADKKLQAIIQAAVDNTIEKVQAEKAAAFDTSIEKKHANIQAAFDTSIEKKHANIQAAFDTKIEKQQADIQAALTVMGQRKSKQDPEGQGIDLRKVNISGVELQKANFSRANLVDADLSEINLRGAYLISADLCEAYLVGADLRGVNLIGAKLRGANLSEANLVGANLGKVDLRHCKNLTSEQIESAITDGNTEWPYHPRPHEI